MLHEYTNEAPQRITAQQTDTLERTPATW